MIQNKTSPIFTHSKGAVFVEFAFVAVIFFMMLSGIVFFSLYLWRYEVLSEGITNTLRDVSVHPGTTQADDLTDISGNPDLSSIAIFPRIKSYITSKYQLIDPNQITPPTTGDIQICQDPTINYHCRVRVKLTWEMPCFGFCIFMPNAKQITVQVDSGMEDPCFLISPGGCVDIPTCT